MGPGDVVAGRWIVEALAGVGGMGAVYRARDTVLGEPIAIKVLATGGAGSAVAAADIERFQREAEVLSTFQHPAIVRYVAHGRGESGEVWLAMEWLEGEDLFARIARGPLEIGEVMELARALASALAEAHARGIVHRDVKPNNILLVGGSVETPKLLDFGIARPLDTNHVRQTGTGVVLGTPGYMAPEQARGVREIDARVDVFALGCVLFEALTGRAAFVGDNVMAVLAKLLLQDAPRARELRRDVPLALDALLASMTAKDPALRPADASVVLEKLARIDQASQAALVSMQPPSFGRVEQRVMSLVLVAPDARVDPRAVTVAATAAETLASPASDVVQAHDRSTSITQVAGAFRGTCAQLLDGTWVVAIGHVRGGAANAVDRALAAVRCARELRTRAPDATIAVATGLSVVGDRAPVGEMIDRAVRLLRAKAEADVRVDAVTAGLVERTFEVTQTPYGFALGAERAVSDDARTLLGRATRCVGRERELANLIGLFDEAAGDGVARVALVTAPAGIGKSRLARELQHRLEERSIAFVQWKGRGDPMRAGAPFALVAQAVRGAAAVRDGEEDAVRAAKLRAYVGERLDAVQRPRVLEFLAELTAIPLAEPSSVQLLAARRNPALLGDQLRRALEDLLLAETKVGPVVWTIDDLQWGDGPSVRLLDAAMRSLRERPFVVFAFARAEVAEVFPRLWSERDALEIRLAPLGRRAAETLVKDVLGDRVDDAAAARLAQRSAGNAFYLEEIIRAAAEGRADALPETAVAMASSRLDELDDDVRRILRAASVFGDATWISALETLVGGDVTVPVRDAVSVLVDRELLATRSESRFPREEELAFRHALVREAAYLSLTDDDRRVGHAMAARFLEAAGETEALTLAEHWDRGGRPDNAVPYRVRAARAALAGNDHEAALRLVDASLAHATGTRRAELLVVAAEAHTWRGELEACERRAREAMQHSERGSATWCIAASFAAQAAGFQAKVDRLEEAAREVLTLPAVDEADVARLLLVCRTATRLLYAGRGALARELLALGETLSHRVDDPIGEGWYLHARSVEATFAGDVTVWRARELEAIACFERGGDLRNAWSGRSNVVQALMELGRFEEAKALAREVIAAMERMALALPLWWTRLRHAATLAHDGDSSAAESLARAVLAAAGDLGSNRLRGAAHLALSQLLLPRDPEAAAHEAEAAVTALEEKTPLRALAWARLADAQRARGLTEEAVGSAEQAVGLLASLGGLEEGGAVVRLSHVEALRAAGRDADARLAIADACARIHARAEQVEESGRALFLAIPEHRATLARS